MKYCNARGADERRVIEVNVSGVWLTWHFLDHLFYSLSKYDPYLCYSVFNNQSVYLQYLKVPIFAI